MAISEVENWEDGYRQKIADKLPGVILSDDDDIEPLYSAKRTRGGKKFSLYRGRCVNGKTEVRSLGSFAARDLLRELSKLEIEMSDEAAEDIQFPFAEDLLLESLYESLPGVFLFDEDELDEVYEDDQLYSVGTNDGERFSLYVGQCVIDKNPPEVNAKLLGTYTAIEVLEELSKLDIEMSGDIAEALQFPSAETIFWERASAALPGEFISTQSVESGSGSWRSDWSVELGADGRWNLYAVYEPIEFTDYDLKGTPEPRGSFDTREEAIAAIETESWGDW
jgi:hypothetical protein